MDTFIEKCNLPKLNEEEAENLNRSITADEIEAVIKKLLTHKTLGWIASQVNFTNHLGRTNYYPSQTIPVYSGRRKTCKLFYKASLTLIPKPGKDTTKKENFRPISVMNIEAKMLNKILANRI